MHKVAHSGPQICHNNKSGVKITLDDEGICIETCKAKEEEEVEGRPEED